MVFTAKPVDDSSGFGDQLKKAREEAGLTREKVSQLLSLPAKYISYLEEGGIAKLPADVYAKGFLRKYALLLAIDGEKLTQDYVRESRIARHLRNQPPQSLPVLRSRRLVVTPKLLGLVGGALALLFIIGYFFYQLHFLLSPPSLILNEPAQNDFVTQESLILFKGRTEPGVKLTINGQQSYIDKDGNFEQTIGLTQGVNTISVEATNRFGKKSEVVKRIMLK